MEKREEAAVSTGKDGLADALEYLFSLLRVMSYFGFVMRQRDGERLVNAVDKMDVHAFLLLRRQVLFNVLAILSREDHMSNSGALGRQEFLLDSTNWKNIAAERDLASHSGERTHLLARQQ